MNFTHILSDPKVPSCPDQLEYAEIGGGLGGFSCPGMEINENPYKTFENHTKVQKSKENDRKQQKPIESHRKPKKTIKKIKNY